MGSEGNGSRELGSLATWSGGQRGIVGKRQTTAQRNAGRNATDAQTANINLRSTPWWWNRRDGAPGYRRRVRNILAVSQFDYGERCPMTALGRGNEPVLPIWGVRRCHWTTMV